MAPHCLHTVHELARWFSVWSQQQQHRLGTCWKCTSCARPHPGPVESGTLGEGPAIWGLTGPPGDSDAQLLLSPSLPESPVISKHPTSLPALPPAQVFTGHQLRTRCGHAAVNQTDARSALLKLAICPPLSLECSSLVPSGQIPAQPSHRCRRCSIDTS